MDDRMLFRRGRIVFLCFEGRSDMIKKLHRPTGSTGSAWQNRIVGYGEEAVEAFLANEKNWRVHPKPQQDALLGSLSAVGIVANVLVNKRTSDQWPDGDRNVETLIDGHLRVTLALREGHPTLPVTYVDLTPEEEVLVLATLDPLSAMATADREKLDLLLHEVRTDDPALQVMLSDLAERENLYFGDETGRAMQDVPDPQLDRAAELQEKWQVKLGDLWGLGRGTTCPQCGKWHNLPQEGTG